MTIRWLPAEQKAVQDAIARHPLESGRCAALARAICAVALPRDATTHGLQVRPPRKSAARFVVPKVPHPPLWASHTLVQTEEHRVDALTGSPGCPAHQYLTTHWQYPNHLDVERVDLAEIDPGIEDDL